MRAPSLGLDHVVVPVRNAAASHRFYADVLGLPLVEALSGDDWGGRPWLMMQFRLADDRQLVLVALRGVAPVRERARAREVRHLAMSVATLAELGRWKRRLALHRVALWEEDHGPQHSIYFADPDGLILEITSPPTPEVARPNAAAGDVVETWLARTKPRSRRRAAPRRGRARA